MGMFRVYLEVEQNKAGELLLRADNITLPSLTRRWLAERLAVLYHKSYPVSTCPTLAKSKGVGLCFTLKMYPNYHRRSTRQVPTPNLVF